MSAGAGAMMMAPLCLGAAAWSAGWARNASYAARAWARLADGAEAGQRSHPARAGPRESLRRWRNAPTSTVCALGGSCVVLAGLAGGAIATLGTTVVLGAVGIARWAYRLGAPARYERTLVDAAEDLARQLRSGASTFAALAVVASSSSGLLGQDLDRLLARIQGGASLIEALAMWAEERPLPAVRLMAGAIGVGTMSGGLRALTADGLATVLRQRDRARREASSLASQAQLSAVVMTVAPLAFAVLLAAGDRAARDFLLRSPAGVACLGAGLALDLGAAAWMIRLTAIVP